MINNIFEDFRKSYDASAKDAIWAKQSGFCRKDEVEALKETMEMKIKD